MWLDLCLVNRIVLLWYHTIIRPFFALDGEDEDAGAEEAMKLLESAEELYPNSALFLYFRYCSSPISKYLSSLFLFCFLSKLSPPWFVRGKVCYLRCQLPEALEVYTRAAVLAKDQREIEHVALYEEGKCISSFCIWE